MRGTGERQTGGFLVSVGAAGPPKAPAGKPS